MKLFTIEDQNRLSEARKESEQRALQLAEILISGRVNESRGFDIGEQLMAEAHKLEKLTIVEAISDQDFNALQKNFRSLLRPIGSLVKNLAGTDLAKKLDSARVEGVELMNDLYEDIKDVEQGVSDPYKSKQISQLRDKLAKTFAEVSVLTKGAMALGDLFSDDPTSVGGYTAMKEITSSLERDDLLSVPLYKAFAAYDEAVKSNSLNQHDRDEAKHDDWFAQGDETTHWDPNARGPRKDNVPGGNVGKKKRGFFSRLFGKHESIERMVYEYDESPETKRGGFSAGAVANSSPEAKSEPSPQFSPEKDPFGSKSKPSHLEKKFRKILQKALVEKSPGFARVVDVHKLIDTLMGKSFDHLAAVFGRFNDLVSNDVDVDFLKQVSKPLGVSGALKSVWDAFSTGTMGGPHGRR